MGVSIIIFIQDQLNMRQDSVSQYIFIFSQVLGQQRRLFWTAFTSSSSLLRCGLLFVTRSHFVKDATTETDKTPSRRNIHVHCAVLQL